MPDLGELADRLDTVMAARGDWPAGSPWIRDAVHELPRDRFAPHRLYRWDGYAYQPVDRAADPDGWAAELYGNPDSAAVTQVTGGLPSSSLSCQAVVVDMLDSLDLQPGHRVLELGTGTGWNAALLAHQAGPGRVVSVETDESLARAAACRLRGVHASVGICVGDGGHGCPEGAPYDRIIATYAVDTVPWAWIEQCAPGGRVVFPWGRLGHVALTVAGDGQSATGRVWGLAQFMPARDSEDQAGHVDYATIRGTGPAGTERPGTRDLAPLRDDSHLQFALRVALPDLHATTGTDEDGVNAWLHDGHASWAALIAETDGSITIYQGGPRRLADELEHAWDQWRALGEPAPQDYGMTVRQGVQYVWCRDAVSGPRWPLEAAVLPEGVRLAG